MYTIVNVPNRIVLPTNPPPSPPPELYDPPDDLRRPVYALPSLPETGFALKTNTTNDSLLCRLSFDGNRLPIVRAGTRYMLEPAVVASWRELEKGLLWIMNTLFESTSSVLARQLQPRVDWFYPSSYRYHEWHGSHGAALRTAILAQRSLYLVAARCSMIIAIWEVEKDSESTSVPHWIRTLHSQRVPRSWIDAIQASDISNFHRGTRVGVVIHSRLCSWPGLLPIMAAKKIPVFFLWTNADHCRHTFHHCPLLRPYLPNIDDLPLARGNLPSGKDPVIYHLYREGSHREHPDLSVEDSTPPHGPYQLPGEVRELFVQRRKDLESRVLKRYSTQRLAARERRMSYASKNMHPHPNSTVYLWTTVDRAFPDKFPTWADKPYRLPVRYTAATDLWISLPTDTRVYNPTFNEWDIWMPDEPDEAQAHLLDLTMVARQAEAVPLAVQDILTKQLEDIGDTRELGEYDMNVESDYVKYWFGFTPSSHRFESVNYEVFRTQVGPVLGYSPEMVPEDEAIRDSIRGWAWAVWERQWESPALKDTWDLDQRNEGRISLPLRHITRVQERAGTDKTEPVLFELTFCEDTEDQLWKLLVGPMGTLYLARHWEVKSSTEAVDLLTVCGIYYHTALPIPLESLSNPSQQRSSFSPPCRPHGFTPTRREYEEYFERVRQFVKTQHARAGLATGGIIWRLLVECLGEDEDIRNLVVDSCSRGPSGEYSVYGEVSERTSSCKFVDDVLSEDELGLIVGVYTTYTSKWPLYGVYIN